ncbi:MAG: efflux RND transporter periplasmic adaptor subunit [Candidatus Aminicenantales bacterium]
MKAKIVIILFAGILIGAVTTYLVVPKAKTLESASQEEGKQLYSCGMHPEVISDKPGNCPICGMKLTPIKSTARGAEKTVTGEAGKERKILYWRAPMDPTEIYDRPGKSKMGMDLIPVYEGEEAGGSGSITIDGAMQQNMNLRVAKAERRDISNVIRAFGKVTYAQDKEFAVNTKINGWIEKLYVNTTGQLVRKGEPLLAIYSPELVSTQEEYLLALNNYKKLASSPYESVRKSAEKMLTLSLDRLKYWDISDAEIDKIEQTGQTRRTILLKSQVTGIVTHKAVVEGDKVSPGMDLFHIADLSKVWVEAAIYESELSLVHQGQRAELELDHVKGQKLEGKVDFIYPYLDQKSQANNVRLVFNNPDLMLKPDMYATVRIYSQTVSQSLAVPSEAVIHSGKRDIVFVTKGDGKFEPREVKTGTESDDGFVQVISGLFDGEEVVVSGQFLLDSESRTREAIAKMRAATAQKAQEPPMELEKGKAEFYTCPMHPDFLTTDKNARCPECGMKLEKVKK